jgi:hypothetical protein
LFGIKESGVTQANKGLEVKMERNAAIRNVVGMLRRELSSTKKASSPCGWRDEAK